MECCVLPGSWIVAHMYTAYLVFAAVIALMLGLWVYARRRVKSKEAVDIVMASTVVPMILLFASLGPLCWRGDYGVVLDGHTLRIRFYEDRTVSLDICNTSVSLVPLEKAREMVTLRVNGVDDPLGGVHAGYYRLASGQGEAMVLVAGGTEEAMVMTGDGKTVIIGLPCIDECFQEITRLKEEICRGTQG
ncbi:hypothetical protein [Pyrodictium abyssi]|uniref:Bacterial Pleckstrin homology domain-containing protein n=1 Tax=Pyrodictium abyssi TaxID=54256 RepID=A0ABN6ZSS5_9CREN|nr:hypothetical protein PABY_11900 [Pyrodictium abyssi]